MDITEEHKKEVWGKLVETVIAALREGMLSNEEYPILSKYVLDGSDKVNNHDEMVQFLRDISGKWPIFTHVLVEETGEIQQANDLKAAQTAGELAKGGNLDEAFSMIKSATTDSSGSSQ